MVHAPELPPPTELAQDPGEDPGADHQAPQGLQALAHHRAHRQVPPGYPPALPQGCHRAPQRSQAQPAGVVRQDIRGRARRVPARRVQAPHLRAGVLPRRGPGASQVRQTGLERGVRLQRDGL